MRVELSVAQLLKLAESWPVARLAIDSPSGPPFCVPIVFAPLDGILWSPIDAKPKRDRPLLRVRLVREAPSVTLLLDHYADDWSELWWVRVTAHAEVRALRDGAVRDSVAAALADKYPQYQTIPVFKPGMDATAIAFTPVDIKAWSTSPDRALP